MYEVHEALWRRFAPLLRRVEKPVRYIGQEYGAVEPADKPHADYHAVLMYPDTYEIGQANQAIAILYDALNADERVYCERAFLPWVDMIELMRERHLPLCSLESFTPLRSFDFVGITLPHEMAATNVLEALDLGGIALHASERGPDDPLVFAGGPCVYNPEPYAPFFDAVFIGEGEEMDLEVALLHRRLRDAGATRADILAELAHVPGVYVPGLYTVHVHETACLRQDGTADMWRSTSVTPGREDVPDVVRKRVIQRFDDTPALVRQVVPYSELVHDRLSIEVLRGCNRGCRFCQAGMMYRPVRERSADSIVAAAMQGLACTGYDEVSLTSLSSTDHSCITDVLRRLNRRFAGTGRGVSLPSQRVDAFGTQLAGLVAGEKKPSLTLAPEAGTQRMRDIINKGVNEEDLFSAIRLAFENGWQRMKLYFMIGLPGETDEDVAGIGRLCHKAYLVAKEAVPEQARARTSVRLTASVALFIPKPCTPFQWAGQIGYAEIEHRIDVLKASMPRKGVDLHWHDSKTSYVEAVLARGGRECAALVERAWRLGARFDAWSDQFSWEAWSRAGDEVGIPIELYATRTYDVDAPLPWDHISCGVRKSFLAREWRKARAGDVTPDCSFGQCSACGVCMDLLVHNSLQGTRVASPSEERRSRLCDATAPAPDAGAIERLRARRAGGERP